MFDDSNADEMRALAKNESTMDLSICVCIYIYANTQDIGHYMLSAWTRTKVAPRCYIPKEHTIFNDMATSLRVIMFEQRQVRSFRVRVSRMSGELYRAHQALLSRVRRLYTEYIYRIVIITMANCGCVCV